MGCPCSKQVAPTPSRRRHPSSQRSESFCDRKKVVDHFRSTLWNKCVDEHGPQIKRRFPMMVVPVKKILEMTEIKKHEEIKDMLVEWKPGMADVLFVSHTWLRRRAPDRDNVKLDLLKSILVQIVAGKMRDIKTHFMAEAYFDAQCIKGTTLSASLCDGYVWMDVMSIPQAQANHDLQSDAIQSIVSYVADSAFFCVLAGAWRHEDGSVRDVRGWHKRGWCRMEMLANALSPRQKPLIVAQSPSVIDLHAPSGPTEQSFVLCPVGQGQFTADSDRKKLAPVIAGLIEARKAYALATGDLFWYRVLHASQRRQLEEVDPSLVAPLEPLADWMVSMRFEGEHKDETGFDEGLTPLRFAAAVAGRVDLTEELLRQPGVDVEAPLTEPVLVFEGQLHFSILMQACQMHDDPKLIRLLLDAGASAEVPDDGVGCNALTHACVTGKCKVIDLLIEHAREREQAEAGAFNRVLMALPTAPSRAISGANFGAKFTPQAVHNFHALAEYGQAAAFRHCAAKHPDEMRRAFKGEEIDIGLSMASWATVMMGDIETLGEILEAAAQVRPTDSDSAPLPSPSDPRPLRPTPTPTISLTQALVPLRSTTCLTWSTPRHRAPVRSGVVAWAVFAAAGHTCQPRPSRPSSRSFTTHSSAPRRCTRLRTSPTSARQGF